MDEDLEVQIKRKEGELSPFQQHMEELKIEFINETICFASEWYKTTTKEYVTKYPEVTLNMKDEKISQMKTKVKELTQNTEKIVKNELDISELWWHQRPRLHDPIDQYLQVADKYPAILDRAVRHVLGYLGSILEEYKFNVSACGKTGSYGEYWFDHPQNGLISNPFYPHLFKWSEQMQDIIQNYNAWYIKAMAVFGELQKLIGEKKKRNAMDRWDSL